jgi:DNA phosphorothioation-dependent restriction protein DptH
VSVELDQPARYREAAWEVSEVIGYVCRLGEIQPNVVYEGVRGIYEQHGFGSATGPTTERPERVRHSRSSD